jgi:flagellar biosynthesis component FlhA
MSLHLFAKNIKNNAALLLLVAMVIRSLAVGPQIGEALVILALSALVAYYRFQDKKQADELDELKADVKLLKDSIQGLKIERAVRRTPGESNQNQGRFF